VRRTSIVAPLLLIAIGGLFLARNLVSGAAAARLPGAVLAFLLSYGACCVWPRCCSGWRRTSRFRRAGFLAANGCW